MIGTPRSTDASRDGFPRVAPFPSPTVGVGPRIVTDHQGSSGILDHHGSSRFLGGRRCSFVLPLARFDSNRRRRDDLEGRVARRGRGGGRAASSRTACNLRSASRRFVTCDREPSSTIRTDRPSRDTRRSRMSGANAEDSPTSNVSSARVAALLACWPPGPPEGPKRHWSSESGMSKRIALFPGSTGHHHRTIRGYARP